MGEHEHLVEVVERRQQVRAQGLGGVVAQRSEFPLEVRLQLPGRQWVPGGDLASGRLDQVLDHDVVVEHDRRVAKLPSRASPSHRAHERHRSLRARRQPPAATRSPSSAPRQSGMGCTAPPWRRGCRARSTPALPPIAQPQPLRLWPRRSPPRARGRLRDLGQNRAARASSTQSRWISVARPGEPSCP
jgi:hypothetical protein